MVIEAKKITISIIVEEKRRITKMTKIIYRNVVRTTGLKTTYRY